MLRKKKREQPFLNMHFKVYAQAWWRRNLKQFKNKYAKCEKNVLNTLFRFCVESLKEWEIKCFKLFKADKSQKDSIVSAIVKLNKELYA